MQQSTLTNVSKFANWIMRMPRDGLTTWFDDLLPDIGSLVLRLVKSHCGHGSKLYLGVALVPCILWMPAHGLLMSTIVVLY